MTTLLIADDIESSRKRLSTFLVRQGYRVLEADNGDSALSLLRSERPDVAITDLLMPTLDGFEFVRRLRSEREIAGTPVIFFSSTFPAGEVTSLARSLGVRHVLQRSSSPDEILDAIREAKSLPILDVSVTDEEFRREHFRLITEKYARHMRVFAEALNNYLNSVPNPACPCPEPESVADDLGRSQDEGSR